MTVPISIGSSSTVAGGTVTITVGAGGVPKGAHIMLAIAHDANASSGSVADTAGNVPYSFSLNRSFNNVTTNGTVFFVRCRNIGTALVNGNTIVYTLPGGATIAAVSAWYAVGLADLSIDVSAVASGSSTTPSVTSPAPTAGGELFIGIIGGQTLVTSFTQDSTNAAWASPPGQVSIAAPVLGGGWAFGDQAGGTMKYAPTLGTSDNWAALIIALFPQAPMDMNSQSMMCLPARRRDPIRRSAVVGWRRSASGLLLRAA